MSPDNACTISADKATHTYGIVTCNTTDACFSPALAHDHFLNVSSLSKLSAELFYSRYNLGTLFRNTWSCNSLDHRAIDQYSDTCTIHLDTIKYLICL